MKWCLTLAFLLSATGCRLDRCCNSYYCLIDSVSDCECRLDPLYHSELDLTRLDNEDGCPVLRRGYPPTTPTPQPPVPAVITVVPISGSAPSSLPAPEPAPPASTPDPLDPLPTPALDPIPTEPRTP